jgi:hypothetical protein
MSMEKDKIYKGDCLEQTKEIWMPIKRLVRFNSKYEIVKEFMYNDGSCVSNLGRVLLSNGKISKTKPDKRGYVVVKLGNEKFKVQQIMMQTFYPEGIRNGYSVDHIDRNPKNNRLDNLRWATISLQTSNRENKLYKYKKVICVENGVVYSSCQEAEESLGLAKNTVSAVARGVLKSIHGYHFHYVGCKLNEEFFEKANKRVKEEQKQLTLF